MRTKIVSIAIIAVIALFGCKKIASTEEFIQVDNASIEKVKNWYDKVPVIINVNLANSKTITALPKGTPDWTRISYNPQERIYTIPVIIPFHGGSAKASTFEYLIVKEDNNRNISDGYYSMIVMDKTKTGAITKSKLTSALMQLKSAPPNFNGAVLQYNIRNEFINAGYYENGQLKSKTDLSTGKPQIGNSLMPTPDCDGTPVCIDWYWQHFENGVLVFEEYLYTTCDCIGGTGGNGGQGNEACQNTFNQILATGTPVSENMGFDALSQTSTHRVGAYHWRIFTASTGIGMGSKYLISTEIGSQNKGGDNKWHWESLNHGAISTAGTGIFDLTGTTKASSTTIGTGALDGYASIVLTFNARIFFGCGNIGLSSEDDYTRPMAWHVTYGWGGGTPPPGGDE